MYLIIEGCMGWEKYEIENCYCCFYCEFVKLGLNDGLNYNIVIKV